MFRGGDKSIKHIRKTEINETISETRKMIIQEVKMGNSIRKTMCAILSVLFIVLPAFICSANADVKKADNDINSIIGENNNGVTIEKLDEKPISLDYSNDAFEGIVKNGVVSTFSYPFTFDLVSENGTYADVIFVPDRKENYSFYITPIGEKNMSASSISEKCRLFIDQQYSFVYSYTIDKTMYVFNGTVSAVMFDRNNEKGKEIVVKYFNVVENETYAGDITGNVLNEIIRNGTRSSGLLLESENNDDYLNANRTYDDYDNYGALDSSGDEDWWVVSFANNGDANFWLGNIPSGCDYDLELYSSDGYTLLDYSRNGSNSQELITFSVSPYTNYYMRVYSFIGTSSSQYFLRAKNYPYAYNLPDQYEYNNTYSYATIINSTTTLAANIHEPTDVDYYRFFVNTPSNLSISLHSIPSNCDYDLYLDNLNYSSIDQSTNAGNSSEYINVNNIPVGWYYIRVIPFGNSYSGDYYFLYLTSTPIAPTIPANSIGVKVQDSSGNPIPNAIVYIYPQRYQSVMYPYDPIITDSAGYAIKSGLSSSASYAVNVIANGYAAKSFSSYIFPSTLYNVITLSNRSLVMLNDPISFFSPINKWPHYSSLSHVNVCSSMCSSFDRICPHTYMNVFTPQNFGWRYGVDSRIEFHQAIDVTATSNDALYNVFPGDAEVTFCQYEQGCGNTVQLKYGDFYATYMHMSLIGVTLGSPVASGALIGYCGSTGTTAEHMHFSLATSNTRYVSKTTDPYNSNILNWNSAEIEQFLDPLAYIN